MALDPRLDTVELNPVVWVAIAEAAPAGAQIRNNVRACACGYLHRGFRLKCTG